MQNKEAFESLKFNYLFKPELDFHVVLRLPKCVFWGPKMWVGGWNLFSKQFFQIKILKIGLKNSLS